MTSRPERQPGPDEGEDASLVARSLAGDRAAQRLLYERHRPGAWRVARSFGDFDADDVEDVVQEAFVRAFRSLAKLEQPARFGPWLLTIARNRALSRLARRKARSELAEELTREAEVASSEEALLPDPDAGAELEVVRRLIADLPEGPEKETVHLFYIEGQLSAREIADRLGVGKSAITMRLERFRAKVKRRVLAEVARLRGDES
ncbi:MAG TPA: RNA polymerase sigma factor [Anaeromyxobacteraceae bacterium]|nr:RNA polymerase sigma factor [Anaeromyxobacteraceae bacterium]